MSDYNVLFLSLWVRDTILGHTREHFSFINYLVSATLLLGDRFEHFLRMHWATPWRPTRCSMEASWRQSLVSSTAGRVQSLLWCCGSIPVVYGENNVEEVFSETVTFLKILITHDHSGSWEVLLNHEKNSNFSQKQHDPGEALAMLSMEKRLVTDFNQRVIEKFCSSSTTGCV